MKLLNVSVPLPLWLWIREDAAACGWKPWRLVLFLLMEAYGFASLIPPELRQQMQQRGRTVEANMAKQLENSAALSPRQAP